MKSVTAIAVATIVMNAGNNSKKSTLSAERRLPGLGILVSAAGVEQHDRFAARNLSSANQGADRRKAGASFRRAQDAFERRHLDARAHQFIVAHGNGFAV